MINFLYKNSVLLILYSLICSTFLSCEKDITEYENRKDEYVFDQWYLHNNKGKVNINLNNTYYKGQGVLVSLVDNGLDIYHEDIVNNVGEGSYSYLSEKYSFTDADHGTACAGIIVAQEDNNIGIRGIAPKAKIIAFNATKTPSIENLADALQRDVERIWVSNNSWGDFNSWGEPLALKKSIEEALIKGTTQGRNGKGTIYIFAAGNGNAIKNGLPTDNVNYSGLVNNRYTIPVAAVDDKGKHIDYSEKGATLMVSAPSKGNNSPGITTTDVTDSLGYNSKVFKNDYKNNNYTKYFSGTSASAPMVTGVVALILEANSSLNWRDVRGILAHSSKKIDLYDEDWQINGAGLSYNHKYGFGLVDADKAIKTSLNWANYGQEKKVSYYRFLNKKIPDNNMVGLFDEIIIEEDFIIEFVEIFFDCPEHIRLGDLEVILISPNGTKSVLAEYHSHLFQGAFRYNNWRFGSVVNFGEKSKGKWKIVVKDKAENFSANLKSWAVKIYGH